MNKTIRKHLKIALVLSLILGIHTAFAAQTCKYDKIKTSTPTTDFIDNGNGTITHKTTGLVWKKCSEGLSGADCATGTAFKKNWKEALQLAGKANTEIFAGYNDWRLPNIIELSSIVEYSCYNPSINQAIFPNTDAEFYWSSSTFPTAPTGFNDNSARCVLFRNGVSIGANKNLEFDRRVRLVRDR